MHASDDSLLRCCVFAHGCNISLKHTHFNLRVCGAKARSTVVLHDKHFDSVGHGACAMLSRVKDFASGGRGSVD
jgi:hypothetical protein